MLELGVWMFFAALATPLAVAATALLTMSSPSSADSRGKHKLPAGSSVTQSWMKKS